VTANANHERTASMGTTLMGALYLGLMVFCMWAAGAERANYTSSCHRIGSNCSAPIQRP
jgi:hypothetical protein